MVRAWHPAVVPMLDDNRLGANHLEAHIMLRAIERREGWFRHPETQCFFEHPEWLVWLHNWTVGVMDFRGWNHRTPVAQPWEPEPPLPQLWKGLLPHLTYKPTWQEWLYQDRADLFRKWESEQRFLPAAGIPQLGRRRRNKEGVYVISSQPLVARDRDFDRDKLASIAEAYPPVEWTPEQSEKLRQLSAQRRIAGVVK